MAQPVGAVFGALALAGIAERFGRLRVLRTAIFVVPVLLCAYAVAPTLALAVPAFVAVGARLWWRRARATNTSQWEHRVGRIGPAVAASIGIFPMWTNPKVLAASAAAGAQIASVRLTVAGAATAVLFYAAVATSTVAAPVLAYLAAGPRIDPALERIRRWIQDRRHAMTASTLVVLGFATVLYGMA